MDKQSFSSNKQSFSSNKQSFSSNKQSFSSNKQSFSSNKQSFSSNKFEPIDFEASKREAFKKNPELKKAYDALELEYSIISQVIKKRLEKGLTQKQLAQIAGTKQSAISRLEGGNANPSIAFLEKISKALGVKLQILLS
jgi:ribosome-binding protein aMBF1 (putative translation factor)